MSVPYVLGVSALFHDSAAALVRGDEIIAAVQEERLNRKKGDWNLPREAVEYCLSHLPEGVVLDHVAYYEDPRLKLDRMIQNALENAPYGTLNFAPMLASLDRMGRELPDWLQSLGAGSSVSVIQHHRAHAASTFYPSPFEEAAVLVVDGVGEWSTTTLWKGQGNTLTPLAEIRYPHSLGLFYSAMTQYCGFKVNSGEYKLMGLAPAGKPRLVDKLLDEVITLGEDGSFSLNLDYFGFETTPSTMSPRLEALLGFGPRFPNEAMTPQHKNLAASAQLIVERAMVGLARAALAKAGSRNLCLAGGVALNCVANAKIFEQVEGLERIFVQPAAGDAGGALGAALEVSAHLGAPRPKAHGHRDAMKGAFLGPGYSDAQVEAAIAEAGLDAERYDDADAYADAVCEELEAGGVVGHFDGRMEFGPRALGNRSILADPRPPRMMQTVNLRIKFREGWRPFAPVVLADHAAELFEGQIDSPYMLFVANRRSDDGKSFPAIEHLDGTSRLQTIEGPGAGRVFALVNRFHERTGCPMLLNTSFNVRGEPIVCTPEDAIRCFLNTNMDALAIGSFVLRKRDQGEWVKTYVRKARFDAD